jgi:DNA modification methylase
MTVRILHGDCREVMASLPEASVDAVVTDPPYELGFMGNGWDRSGVAFDPETWREALRVLKPGGHLLAFSGTRTYHRMVCAIEDAGFEIRDQIGWLFGSGFPKSLDVSKAIDRRKDWASLRALQAKVSAAREALGISQSEAARRMGLIGPGESLGGGGFMWFETGMRIPTHEQYPALKAALQLDDECDAAFEAAEREVMGVHGSTAAGQNMRHGIGGGDAPLPPGDITAPATDAAKQWQGWGTALKPAWEPIVMARKPLAGTVASNVLEHGTGALNIDGCRVTAGTDYSDLQVTQGGATRFTQDGANHGRSTTFKPGAGRWPANVIHDGSDEVLAAFPKAPGQAGTVTGNEPTGNGFSGAVYSGGMKAGRAAMQPRGDTGSAARFFYCAKADKSDRHDGLQDPGPQFKQGRMPHDAQQVEKGKRGNHHPTVKPTDLMRYLCRLVTPPGGTVLDPFMGSGSTLKAAELEGFCAIGIELDPAYIEIAKRRIASDMPLFAEVAS